MRRKRKWLIVICVLLVLITISQILKHFNYGTESKEAYNTYTVEKERQLDLQGKAYPREVLKHIIKIIRLEHIWVCK